MFLFKCCSNHSLPTFLKSSSSKTPASPSGSPKNQSPTNRFQISNKQFVGELATVDKSDQTAQSTDDTSTDSDFGSVDVAPKKSSKDASSRRKIFHKKKAISAISSDMREKSGNQQGRDASKSCVAMLVGNNKVKTAIVKHHCSPMSGSFMLDPIIRKNDNTTLPHTKEAVSLLKDVNKKSPANEKNSYCSLQDVPLFAVSNGAMVSTDHGEFYTVSNIERPTMLVDKASYTNQFFETALPCPGLTQLDVNESADCSLIEAMLKERLRCFDTSSASERSSSSQNILDRSSPLFCSTDSDVYLSNASNTNTSAETCDLLCYSTHSDLSTKSLSSDYLDVDLRGARLSLDNNFVFAAAEENYRELQDYVNLSLVGEQQSKITAGVNEISDLTAPLEFTQPCNDSTCLKDSEVDQCVDNILQKYAEKISADLLKKVHCSIVDADLRIDPKFPTEDDGTSSAEKTSMLEKEESDKADSDSYRNAAFLSKLASVTLAAVEESDEMFSYSSSFDTDHTRYDNSSTGLMLTEDSATFLDGFTEKDDKDPPVVFTIINEESSPSNSDDSTRNAVKVPSPEDDLLFLESKVGLALRPSTFEASQLTCPFSPETENSSSNNSTNESSLQSPESPAGVDFQHFYSKSFPSLNGHSYNSMSSLSLIEEYFSRFVIECKDCENSLGSRVDPKPDAASTDDHAKADYGPKCCCDNNQCRKQSFEKLTEICKQFSSKYLNYIPTDHVDGTDVSMANSTAVSSSMAGVSQKGGDGQDAPRSQSSAALSALYAAMLSQGNCIVAAAKNEETNVPETSVDNVVPTNLTAAKKKPSLVGRSVSLRENSQTGFSKTTGKKKKAVKFADSIGLELAIVRLILSGENLSDEDFQQRFQAASATYCNSTNSSINSNNNSTTNLSSGTNNNRQSRQCRVGLKTKISNIESRRIVAEFNQPVNSEEFVKRVETHNVLLESCLPEEKSRSVSGCVRVRNLTYEKSVVIRYTLNDWLSYNETPATFIYGSNDGPTDRFSFAIKLPPFFDVGSSLEFAILYLTEDGRAFWDNNDGCNYRMRCQKCEA